MFPMLRQALEAVCYTKLGFFCDLTYETAHSVVNILTVLILVSLIPTGTYTQADAVAADTASLQPIKLRNVWVYPFADADALIDFVNARKGVLVAVNAEKMARGNERITDIINSNIGYCDGVGPVMAARQKGAAVTKIAGCELWLKIVERYHADKTFYVIGAVEDVNRATVDKLQALYPDIRIVGRHNGFFADENERQQLIDDVVEKKPDVVFVAMGTPTQELLMQQMAERHKAIYQGLGGSYDVFTGKVKRAPKWWLDHNLEFAYRFVRQPGKRLCRDMVYLKFAWWLLRHDF